MMSWWRHNGRTARRGLAALAALVLLSPALSLAQSPQALQQDIETLKAGQHAIQKDLEEMKTLLRATPRGRAAAPAVPQNVVLNVAGAAFQGDKDARLTLVEYTDFQCPFCARYARDTFPQLAAEYIQTGKVKYVRRDFPLESIHPHAFKAAEAAHCAQEQGKGWELHGRLFGHQQQLAPTDWPGHAQALGLDASAFQQCLESGKYAARIRQDMSEAQAAGVTGTPSFFLGVSDPSGKVKATRMFKGAQAYAAFKAAIDDLLVEKQ
jgi:protein-disulfide isomerase